MTTDRRPNFPNRLNWPVRATIALSLGLAGCGPLNPLTPDQNPPTPRSEFTPTVPAPIPTATEAPTLIPTAVIEPTATIPSPTEQAPTEIEISGWTGGVIPEFGGPDDQIKRLDWNPNAPWAQDLINNGYTLIADSGKNLVGAQVTLPDTRSYIVAPWTEPVGVSNRSAAASNGFFSVYEQDAVKELVYFGLYPAAPEGDNFVLAKRNDGILVGLYINGGDVVEIDGHTVQVPLGTKYAVNFETFTATIGEGESATTISFAEPINHTKTSRLDYEVEGASEWFGGFTIDLGLTTTGKQVGFVDAENGPRIMYEQILWAIIYQSGGKYGSDIAQIENYLKNNQGVIPDFILPEVADDSGGRVPPFIQPASPVRLDLKQGVLFQRASTPPSGCSAMHISSSNISSCLGVSDGRLVFTDDDWYPLLDSIAFAPITRFAKFLEATADIHNVQKYPHLRNQDYFTVAMREWKNLVNDNQPSTILRLDARAFAYVYDNDKVYSIINALP